MWNIETLNEVVDAEIAALPADQIARFLRIVDLIKSLGLEKVTEPHLKHLVGPLWEMRMKGRNGISRAIYIVMKPKRVIVVRVFVKKTQQTPRREIELALKRAKDVR